jgi:hypothetical protein
MASIELRVTDKTLGEHPRLGIQWSNGSPLSDVRTLGFRSEMVAQKILGSILLLEFSTLMAAHGSI